MMINEYDIKRNWGYEIRKNILNEHSKLLSDNISQWSEDTINAKIKIRAKRNAKGAVDGDNPFLFFVETYAFHKELKIIDDHTTRIIEPLKYRVLYEIIDSDYFWVYQQTLVINSRSPHSQLLGRCKI